MVTTIINWLLSLITEFAKFGSWLTTPLPYIDLAPIYIFGFTGLVAIIGISLIRLFIGG